MITAEQPAAGVPLATPTGRWVLACSVLGSGMAMLDGTIVNIALPRIGQDLGATLADLQWTLNGYLLTLAGLILLGGGLGDRYGRRRVFVIGVIWFAVASAVCAAAPNSGVLIAARALQGVGGALLTPVRWRWCSRPSGPRTGPRRSVRGPGSAVWRARSGPFLGGFLVDGPGGAGSSW